MQPLGRYSRPKKRETERDTAWLRSRTMARHGCPTDLTKSVWQGLMAALRLERLAIWSRGEFHLWRTLIDVSFAPLSTRHVSAYDPIMSSLAPPFPIVCSCNVWTIRRRRFVRYDRFRSDKQPQGPEAEPGVARVGRQWGQTPSWRPHVCQPVLAAALWLHEHLRYRSTWTKFPGYMAPEEKYKFNFVSTLSVGV